MPWTADSTLITADSTYYTADGGYVGPAQGNGMSASIPAAKLVAVQPGVVGTGGNPLALNGVFATQSPFVPIGAVQKSVGLTDVENFFGIGSPEALMAAVYFTGFKNCTTLPSALYFAQYNEDPVSGYLRSGPFAGVPLSALQALSGILDTSVDGRPVQSANINLATATSFTNAAALIQTGLRAAGAAFTGAGTITADVLDITAVTEGELLVGDTITGGAIPGGVTIVSLGTGTGGVGTYNVSAVADQGAGPILVAGPLVVVSFNSTLQEFIIESPTTGVDSAVTFATGSLSVGLLLTQATGAIVSQGAAANNPVAFINGVIARTQNWVSLTTTWEPTIDEQVGFASAVNASSPAGNERFIFVGETTDITLTEGPAPDSFPGRTVAFNGRVAAYADPSLVTSYGLLAAFVCGTAASIDWARKNGRISFACKGNSQLTPGVTDLAISDNLDDNGVNYYGAFATANTNFQLFQTGQISGAWTWIDPYVNQIYLNSQFQVAILSYLAAVNATPYNDAGYGLLRASMMAPIKEALNNGSIVKGVELSDSQIAAVNSQAGLQIDGVLFSQGWYLQILDPGAQARGLRKSPVMTFWYTDGGSVQSINLASLDVM